MNLQRLKYYFFCVAILTGLAMLVSCKPDIKTIEAITIDENQPMETATDLRIIYSSGGRVQMIMEAPSMRKFEGEKPHMELPEGFLMMFYDSLMQETSRISAKYAIQYQIDELIDARNDVIVQNNENGEKLNTEQLIWDQKRMLIYTEKFVKITTQDEVLYGDGFESDDRFTNWVIKNPTGTFYIDTSQDTGNNPL